MDVRRVRIAKINPAPYNPRKDLQPGDPEYEAIRRSLEEFGFVEPLVWNKRTGHLVGGHQRFKILLARGVREVDVSVVDLPLEREKALNVALNKVGGEWDDRKLGELLKELQALPGLDETVTGFSTREINALLRSLEPAKPEPDGNVDRAAVAAKGIKVVRGQVWQLGRHRLVCGDSTTLADVDRLMAGRQADMCFTDPPYNVDYAGGNQRHPSWGKQWVGVHIANDDISRKDWRAFSLLWLQQMMRVLTGGAFICMGMREYPTLRQTFEEAGGHWSTDIVWVKNSHVLRAANYHARHETLLYGWPEGREHYWCGAHDRNTVWEIDRNRVNEWHPTEKPLELIERAMADACPADGVVFDPFCGSGSTIVAAERTGRTCHALEIEPKWCAVTIARWELYTSQKARLSTEPKPKRRRPALARV
jgi:DNA modification methylase